jgi:hypothetical protein
LEFGWIFINIAPLSYHRPYPLSHTDRSLTTKLIA